MGGPNNVQPQVPQDIIKAYHAHPKFGAEFNCMVTDFHEEFGEPQVDSSVPPDTTPVKKRNNVEPMSSNKKPKVDTALSVESSTLADELKHECTVVNFKGGGVKLQVRWTQNCFVNTGSRPNTLPAHSWICGLPRGTFKLVKSDDEVTDSMWVFNLSNSDDLIVLNGVVQSLGPAYLEKLKTDANAKIAYHNIGDRSTDMPGTFAVNQTHKIAFSLISEGSAEHKSANVFGACVPLKTWNTKYSQVLWQVKWTAKGLTPVKPAIYSKAELELLPGRCIILL